MPKTILVTGCAGFIGGNFVKKFKEQFPETTIVGIDDFSTGRRDAFDPKTISFYEGSVLDRELSNNIFEKHKPEYVFHFAAIPRVPFSVENPYQTNNVNVGGTVALLEEAKRVLKVGGRVILIEWSDSFGGIGPRASDVLAESVARELLTRAGFAFERSIKTPGEHHYGLVLKKS